MKSRISFFNGTAFKKNLTRFAPLWGLYTVGLLMCLVLMAENGPEHWLYSDIVQSINIMPLANLGYALLCAQLLFGDLYNTRMCNALHAMPVRREGWFVTNLASGLLFSLVPTGVMTIGALIMSPFSKMINAWQIPLYWFLASNLQFLCFFGLAVFSAFCVGNRFAQAIIYGILNFVSIIAYWLVDTLYTPLFYGVKTASTPFERFCPFVSMIDGAFIDCERILDETYTDLTGVHSIYHGEFTLEGDWWYLWVCAAVGVVLMAAALQMYRKRKLETAGDFMAIRVLEPVFQVAYTMIVGTVFQFVVDDMFGLTQMPLFLVIGLAVGWFTGKMLTERNVRVFRVSNFLGFLLLAGVFALTLIGALLDPTGIEEWLPDAEEVKSVTVSTGHGYYSSDEITLEDTADIETIIAIHEEGFTDRIDEIDWFTLEAEGYDAREMIPVTIEYEMQDGSDHTRYYYYWVDEGGGAVLETYFTTVEAVFGTPDPDLDRFIPSSQSYGYSSAALRDILETADLQGLLEAVIADCEAGTMAQNYLYHRDAYALVWLSVSDYVPTENGDVIVQTEIEIYSDNENCVAWLEEQGFDLQAYIDAEG